MLLNFLRGPSSGQKQLIVIIAAVAAGLLIFLIAGDKPWRPEIVNRLAGGRNLRVQDYATIWLWRAAALNLLLILALLVTVRFWSRPQPVALSAPAALPAGRSGALYYSLTAAAMLLLAVITLPRLSLSLWGDEGYSQRRFIVGDYRQLPDGELEFRELRWRDTLWDYRNPNNHILFSISSRLSNRAWQAIFWSGEGLRFSEVAVRLPAWLAGIAAVGGMAFFLWHLGYPGAGAIAAFAMAIHPWFIRYAAEARGYSMMLLFLLLGWTFLVKAIREGHWRWWAFYGASQFLMLYAYPGALYVALTQNIAAAAAILMIHGARGAGAVQLMRWAVANVAGAMVMIQLYAPCVPQLLEYLDRDRAKGEAGATWVQDVWGYLSTGMSWNVWDGTNPLALAVAPMAESAPLHYLLALLLIPLLALAGFIRLMLGGKLHSCVALAMLLAAPISYFAAVSQGTLLYTWYLLYALPALLVFIALALDGVGTLLRHPVAGAAAAALYLGWFAIFTSPQRQILQTHSTEPARESVLATRPLLDPYAAENQKIMTLGFLMTVTSYDPAQRSFADLEEMLALMAEAEKNGQVLYINFGQWELARLRFPEAMRIMEDPARFEHIGDFYGLEPFTTRHVYRAISN